MRKRKSRPHFITTDTHPPQLVNVTTIGRVFIKERGGEIAVACELAESDRLVYLAFYDTYTDAEDGLTVWMNRITT